jgi:hypothetical protein
MPRRFESDCAQCGIHYVGQGRRFCSRSCRMTYSNLRDNPAKSVVARRKISLARKGRPTTTGRRLPRSQRRKIAASLKGRKLAIEHRKAIAASLVGVAHGPIHPNPLRGPKHPNWRGGHTAARHVDYRSKRYIAFRSAVLRRDNWTCQECKARGGKLEVHHLKAWGPYPSLRYETSNAMTLCKPCHDLTKKSPRPVTVGARTLAESLSGRP